VTKLTLMNRARKKKNKPLENKPLKRKESHISGNLGRLEIKKKVKTVIIFQDSKKKRNAVKKKHWPHDEGKKLHHVSKYLGEG